MWLTSLYERAEAFFLEVSYNAFEGLPKLV